MALMPSYQSRKEYRHKFGLGFDVSGLAAPHTWARVIQILAHVRRVELTPLDAHRSMACQIAKPGIVKTEGTKALRLIHVLCPFWRCWHRALYVGMGAWNARPQLHGCLPGRRREDAIATQMIT
eukprot:14500341-Alexandrium_andersonii.AAC.1